MKRPHPASLILLGLAVLVAASSREGKVLVLVSLGLALVALLVAPSHLRLLLRRSRWLLLTMLVMFGWLTPGTPLANLPGASREGLLLAAENLARLLIALSTVALVLKALAPPELVAGLRSLLAPLALLKLSRDRVAVRLALTLNEVESPGAGDDGEPGHLMGTLALPASVPGATDLVVGVLAAALVVGAWLT